MEPSTEPPLPHTLTAAAAPPDVDVELLSSLLRPPDPSLPALSDSAPRLHARLLQYEQRPHPQHHRALVSTIADGVALSSSLYPSTAALLSHMSHADLLRLHLADLLVLCEALIDALSPAHVLVTQSTSFGPSPFPPSPAAAPLSVLSRVLDKQRLISLTVASLAQHQRRQRDIEALQADIAGLDALLIAFAKRLSGAEHALEALLTADEDDEGRRRTTRPVSVADLMQYAASVASMSFAPADITERKGQSLSRPPAPLEAEMGVSLLQMTLEEMRGWVEARRREAAQSDTPMLPAPQPQAAMPSVAEVQKAAVAAGEGPSLRKVASTGQPPPVASSTLDLDLNPDDEDSDDDDDDDSDDNT